ncbi:MAG: fumarylacetoacetate hydrolase family protein [Bacteroidota bacterium]|nr:fumarylacetoacetate hydrolase family protein [Bacteroidota bacterium]MDP4233911.1 fumarylacetoacetate hydrolase family protein [Bacteroidota bacterium]MDP4242839.1 fumarylacetoacetate hydrolase family protein [Bacteroidota bacterium]MDP4288317.1 fumarylacetoacetate hydrolase family protein [Bacteroidota bacterium]
MKIVTYRTRSSSARVGIIAGQEIIDLERVSTGPDVLPNEVIAFLRLGDPAMARAREILSVALDDPKAFPNARVQRASAELLAPIPRPTSMRDGYAFRQHVEAARRNRGVEMIPEFDLFPVFYFTNHQAVIGPGPLQVMPEHLNRLDYELEAAIVIGREGRNIKASEADDYVAGYMVMNDWSARALQMEEMKLSLGPAKGKDFATAIGPYLVTRDELIPYRIAGASGERYDLTMTASLNGKELSRGNLKDMTWTFAQIIERASYGVTLFPGDVIGSGTVGTGCLLELNGSKITDNLWIKEGDTVTCAVEALGELTNTVVKML